MKAIEITTGMNGYPKGLHRGYIDFESMEDAEQFAKENNGTVVTLHKRDGWQLWESKGRAWEMLTNSAEDYGDGYFEFDKVENWDRDCRETLRWMIDDDAPLTDLQDTIKDMMTVREEIEDLDEGDFVLTCNGKYYDTLPKKSMHIYYDTHTYEIGVEVFSKIDEEE